MEGETDWEDCYRRGETPWDKGTPSPGLVQWLEETGIEGRVLVPGCGLGHDVRALARAGADEVIGLDISPSAVAAAQAQDPVGREDYRLGDLFDLDGDLVGAFDWVWEHTCFCAIDPARREDYVAAVRKALIPGGRLFAVFYLDPYDTEHPPGEGPPHGVSLEDLGELFGRWFAVEESWVPALAYEGREGREQMMILRRSD